MGGMVGQGLLIRYPQLVHAAVLAHTVSSYAPASREAWAGRIATVRAAGMAAVADLVVSRYLGETFRARNPALVQSLRSQLLAIDSQACARSCQAVADVDWTTRLSEIRCPVLVIAGRYDLGAPPAEAERTAECHTGCSAPRSGAQFAPQSDRRTRGVLRGARVLPRRDLDLARGRRHDADRCQVQVVHAFAQDQQGGGGVAVREP